MSTEYGNQSTRTVNLREQRKPALSRLFLTMQSDRIMSPNRPTGQQCVAEADTLNIHTPFKHMVVSQLSGQLGSQVGRLVAPNFLKGDNVGIDLGKSRRNGGLAALPWPECVCPER